MGIVPGTCGREQVGTSCACERPACDKPRRHEGPAHLPGVVTAVCQLGEAWQHGAFEDNVTESAPSEFPGGVWLAVPGPSVKERGGALLQAAVCSPGCP